jgi:hypothetical protein
MLDQNTINSRLSEMRQNPALNILWDETCEGSGRALVVFIGPSPGGQKPEARRPMHKACFRPLWDESFDKPLSWSRGFRVSFQPLVEALFRLPYATAGKLIARANLDWLGNPESEDVAEQFMFEGAPSTLRLLEDCSPEVILPMDLKTFHVMKEVLGKAGYLITDCNVREFLVCIPGKLDRRHRNLQAFLATREERDMLVMKLPQHPARMFRADYGTRCGEALRDAAIQLLEERTANVPKG